MLLVSAGAFGSRVHFSKSRAEGIENVDNGAGGTCRFNLSSDGPGRFAVFATGGDFYGEPDGSDAARHLLFVVPEILEHATGLGALGLIGWCRKRKSVAVAA